MDKPIRIDDEFIAAVKSGDIANLQELLDEGASMNCLGSDGKSAVLTATEARSLDVLQWLIQQGADVDYYDSSLDITDQTPFLYAGAQGLDDVLDILIPAKPDVTILNGFGGTALIPACERGHVSTVRKLLEETDVDVNHVNRLGWTALLEAVILGDGSEKYQETVRLLIHHGADVNLADKDGVTPLEHAKAKGYDEIAKLL